MFSLWKENLLTHLGPDLKPTRWKVVHWLQWVLDQAPHFFDECPEKLK